MPLHFNLTQFWPQITCFFPFKNFLFLITATISDEVRIYQATILNGSHPRTIPDKLDSSWVSSFKGEDLLMIICFKKKPQKPQRAPNHATTFKI